MRRRCRNPLTVLICITAMLLASPTDSYPQAEPIPSADAGNDEELLETLEALKDWCENTRKQQGAPGMAAAIVDREGIIWSAGFGVTGKDASRDVTSETLFSIQSMSKTVTTTAILTAVRDGLLDLDAPITRYLPDFTVHSRFEEHPERKMTLRHLLSHRAGFTHEAPLGNNYDGQSPTLREHAASISNTWLRYPVGQRYSYSNLGIDLAGYILEVASGKSFAAYVKEKLFTPLGMPDSSFDWDEIESAANRAKGHDPVHDAVPLRHGLIPCGACYASARDMAGFIRFHLNGGKVNGKRHLDEKLLSAMTEAPHPVDSSVFYQTLGLFKGNWFQASPFKNDYLHHSGGGLGFRSNMKWFPKYGIGAVILANTSRFPAEYVCESLLYSLIVLRHDPNPVGMPGAAPKIVEVDEAIQEALLGRYGPSGRDMEVKYKKGRLGVRLPDNSFKFLNFLSEKEAFIIKNGESFITLYRFMPAEKGCPRYILNVNRGDTYDFNDAPGDPRGPDKPEWLLYVGKYEWIQWGKVTSTREVLMKKGYLYLDRIRLTEHEPGLFFTHHGEALDFRGEVPTYRNVVMRRKP